MHTNRKVLVKPLKAQYGCVDSAKLWYNHISNARIEQGFSINVFDKYFFFQKKQDRETWTYITIYVDDLLLIANDKVKEVDEVIRKLNVPQKEDS